MRYYELAESKLITVYHGDNYNTTFINPKLMNNGNNQEGIGIYFSDNIETARSYGKNIISAKVDLRRFVPSRAEIGDVINAKQLQRILHDLWPIDPETMFYWVSDWVDVAIPDDVKSRHIDELTKNLLGEQVRNIQVDLAERFGVENFVAAWNRYTNIDGTYFRSRDDDTWFAVINPNIPIAKVEK